MDTKHILVLGDELPTRKMLETMLTAAGYRVTAVGDGASALRVAREDRPDLVVCDLSMSGIDGYQVINMLRRVHIFEAPIIVVSGRARDKDRRVAMDAGADAFLPKPVAKETLLVAVARWIAPSAAVEAAPEPDADDKRQVLVVEDEAATRMLLESELLSAGYRVTAVSNGAAAIERVKADPPDLMLCDLMMPGMDGISVIETLRNDLGFKGPIIVVSGKAGDQTHRDAIKAGANSFLYKPVSMTLLLNHVAHYLAKSTG